ncbi:MAG: radical SAM protein [wastewater metagenome]|nr:radical SAM protein [Candidatus Loosdrechtia aerotolerans]
MKLKINKYYLPDAEAPILTRIINRLTRRAIPVFPRTVQLETQAGCNASCIFCDYGISYSKQPKGKIDWELFRKIVDECSQYRVHRFSPYLTNEPFADSEMIDRIQYIQSKMPRTKITVTTNGHFLVRELTDQLVSLQKPLHALYISFQGIDKNAYEATMRGNMKFERTMENVNYLIDRMQNEHLKRPDVWITMVDTKIIDTHKALAYWKSRGVKAKYTTLENRGGNILDIEKLQKNNTMTYYTACTRLFKQMYIHFNGDVVLCCVDNSRKVVLGNAREQTLYEIWNGEKAVSHRQRFLNHEFNDLALCSTCKIDNVRIITNE